MNRKQNGGISFYNRKVQHLPSCFPHPNPTQTRKEQEKDGWSDEERESDRREEKVKTVEEWREATERNHSLLLSLSPLIFLQSLTSLMLCSVTNSSVSNKKRETVNKVTLSFVRLRLSILSAIRERENMNE